MSHSPHNSDNAMAELELFDQERCFYARRVLVVTQSRGLSRLVRFRLMQAGFDTDAATDAAAAVDLLAETEYDLLVTEQSLPDMSAADLLTYAQASQGVAIPVLLCSTRPTLAEAARLQKDFNIFHVVVRPFSPWSVSLAVEDRLRPVAVCRGSSNTAHPSR